MMTTLDDIEMVLRFFKGAGLKSVPPEDEAHHWLRVLSDVPGELLQMAADWYVRTPTPDKDNRLRGQRFAPSASELRVIAFDLEAEQRHQVAVSRRGCARCGEVLDEEGKIADHGTGYRTLIQHCYPRVEGMVRYDLPPYRIGSRKVLCDCSKGDWIARQQGTVDRTKMPHVEDWQPTLTIKQALQRFERRDGVLYITGSTQRAHDHDVRSGSPFFSRPSPEELLGFTEQAAGQRANCYKVIRGQLDAEARMPVKLQC